MNERPIPLAATRDEKSVEMLRVWIAEHKLHCSLKVGMYREMNIPEELAWGTILADAARHIAKALSEQNEKSEDSLLELIRGHFNAELDAPTSPAAGGFIES